MEKLFKLILTMLMVLIIAGCQSEIDDGCGPNGENCVQPEATIEMVTPTEVDNGIHSVYLAETIQSTYRDYVNGLSSFQLVDNRNKADIVIDIPGGELINDPEGEIRWMYVMAVPFNIPAINIDTKTVERAWNGIRFPTYHYQPLYMAESTAAYFSSLWGNPNIHTIKVLPDDEFTQAIVNNEAYWAIMPFEELPSTWRILSVEGIYPLDRDINWDDYALSVTYSIDSKLKDIDLSPLLTTNFNPEKMSIVLLTGTTALVRNLSYEMEMQGMNYAIENVKDTFLSADISHISNEVPMFADCPSAIPVRREMRFCSSPAYFELFETLDISFIELSGNHELDWFEEPFLETLRLYKDKYMPYVGGGINLKEALQPLEMDDHGNHFVFLSCNAVGPEQNLATDNQAGAAPCDFDRMMFDIGQYTKVGYIPIVLLQHYEVDTVTPNSLQRIDFSALAEAGAVIVSGSQAHNPQTYAFVGDSLIHYGLGNTFFDQTYEPNSLAILDKHIFYNGKYFTTQIIPIETNSQYQVGLLPDEKIPVFIETILEPMK